MSAGRVDLDTVRDALVKLGMTFAAEALLEVMDEAVKAQQAAWRQINALLVSKAKEGNVVARLKGGDPYIFGRGGEEGEELAAAGIPFEEVPGISSTIAAPAYAGIPLTHRDFASSVNDRTAVADC